MHFFHYMCSIKVVFFSAFVFYLSLSISRSLSLSLSYVSACVRGCLCVWCVSCVSILITCCITIIIVYSSVCVFVRCVGVVAFKGGGNVCVCVLGRGGVGVGCL